MLAAGVRVGEVERYLRQGVRVGGAVGGRGEGFEAREGGVRGVVEEGYEGVGG